MPKVSTQLKNAGDFEALPPLPVRRERDGVRVIASVGSDFSLEITLTLTLSRNTGRGDQITTPFVQIPKALPRVSAIWRFTKSRLPFSSFGL
jgi:hypothetical protein